MRTLLLSFLLASGCEPGSEDKRDVWVDEGDDEPVYVGCDDPMFDFSTPELCDGIDNNCDGVVDEGVTSVFYADVDADGFGDINTAAEQCEPPRGWVADAADCDDGNPLINPDAEEICNEVDDDCDALVDEDVEIVVYADADGDGYGEFPVDACYIDAGFVLVGGDCDDTDPQSFPGNPEFCDEADNDCAGGVDDGVTTTYYADRDGDSWGDPSLTQEACVTPTGYAGRANDCDDYDVSVSPSTPEVCDDLDQNCDGVADEGFDADGDGVADCFDVEQCDGLDNDGDGLVDDADSPVAGTTTWFADTDGDGFGDPSGARAACVVPDGYLADETDCDDRAAGVFPGASERCNGVDDDCDGAVDEGAPDSDGDGTCDAFDVEQCDGRDNDGDGAADEGLTCNYRLVRSGLTTGLCVDDDVYVNLNGARIYTDTTWGAQCGHVVNFTATPGDTLAIWAVDSIGTCRAIDNVYIVNVSGGVSQLLATGFPNSCGHSASTSAFWSQSVAVPGAF